MTVEHIEKQRTRYSTSEAIYFLTPCRDSILRLVDDFRDHAHPHYKAAHVHFTSGLDDRMFTDLNQRLKVLGASEYILCLKEMYVDFMVVESSVFRLEPSLSFASVFGTHGQQNTLSITAKQLLSVCATLGEDPIIRYQAASENFSIAPPKATQMLATLVQQEMDTFCRLSPNFPPHRSQPRATLLIVDRSVDLIAPLLHEFTYQAMINDLLPVVPNENQTGIQYTHEFNQEDGSMTTKDVVLNEEDSVYNSIRHLHIAECSDTLVKDFNQFLEAHKSTAQNEDAPRDVTKNLKEMKELITNIPKYQEMKAKYSAHLTIAQECMTSFERQKLNSVGNLEQNMATGETPTGETPKTIVLDMVPLLDDPHVSSLDKARLLMQYILYKQGNLFEDDKRKLIEHAKLPAALRDAIENLSLMGVKTSRARNTGEKTVKKKIRRRGDAAPFELSRYVPVVKRVIEAHLTNTLESSRFAYTRPSDMEPAEEANLSPAIPASGVSLRTTKPTWNKKGSGLGTSKAKVIVFVLGGMTYSEIRSVYELAQVYERDIYIGTTDILKPSTFVTALSTLRHPLPALPSVVPSYVPPPSLPSHGPREHTLPKMPHPISQQSPTSTASQPTSHTSYTSQSSTASTASTASTSHLSLSHLSIRSGTSSMSPVEKEDKDKKKKRGLKKLFG
ncbi:Sec1-like protein [Spinellus fusiger]|nr:Sec1-like protein [Spinellus fusiger]